MPKLMLVKIEILLVRWTQPSVHENDERNDETLLQHGFTATT